MLLVFSEDNVPTWEVRRKAKRGGGGGGSDLVVGGAADTFEAAKAAALFETTARSAEGDVPLCVEIRGTGAAG